MWAMLDEYWNMVRYSKSQQMFSVLEELNKDSSMNLVRIQFISFISSALLFGLEIRRHTGRRYSCSLVKLESVLHIYKAPCSNTSVWLRDVVAYLFRINVIDTLIEYCEMSLLYLHWMNLTDITIATCWYKHDVACCESGFVRTSCWRYWSRDWLYRFLELGLLNKSK